MKSALAVEEADTSGKQAWKTDDASLSVRY